MRCLADVPSTKCTVQPVCVESSCSFVVDLKCVADPIDLRADDWGTWKHQGLRKTWVIADGAGVVLSQHRKCAPKQQDLPPDGNLYELTRVYHVLQASPDFKWMIATLRGRYMYT